MALRKAKPQNRYLRMLIFGQTGAGKTYTSLRVAEALTAQKIALIDTEAYTSELFAKSSSNPTGIDFDILGLDRYSSDDYIHAIEEVQMAMEYDILIIDSLSHLWMGEGGILETTDKIARGNNAKNSFSAWLDTKPMYKKVIQKILNAASVSPDKIRGYSVSPLHIICTARAKSLYSEDVDERTGKKKITKLGLDPVLEKDSDFEMDIVAEMDSSNTLYLRKVRGLGLEQGKSYQKPNVHFANDLKAWMHFSGEPIVVPPSTEVVTPPPTKPILEAKPIITTLSPAQLKEIWGVATGKGWTKDGFEEMLHKNGWAAFKEVPDTKKDKDKLMKLINAGMNAAPQTEDPAFQVITEQEVKELYSLAQEKGWSKSALTLAIKEAIGAESLEAVQNHQVGEVFELINVGVPA